ncbi:MAG: hypothetical protein R2880_09905 [Deinococcales bacterium]
MEPFLASSQYADLEVVDFHVHFPIENTMGYAASPKRHPKLVAYGEERIPVCTKNGPPALASL